MILPEEMECVQFLQGLDEQQRKCIIGMAQLKECPPGTILFQEGQDSSVIYCVLHGTVSLEVGDAAGESVEIATVGPGDLLGWSPVLGRRAMTATARAATRCRLAVLHAPQILALCEREPRFGVAFLREVALVLSERLSSTRRHLALARTVSQRSPLEVSLEGKD